MNIEELINRPSEGKLRKIIDKWWNTYEKDKKCSLDQLITILLHSAGINHSFDLDSFPNENLKKYLFYQDYEISNVPISLQHFSKTLSKVLDILFQRKYWAIIQDFSFIFPLVSVIEYMRGSPHDSVRAVCYLSGIKILKQSHNLSEYLESAHYSDKTSMVQRVKELQNKMHINFRYNMRDNASRLRTIPLIELLSWSEENPDAIIEENFRKYIFRGLKDSLIENRKISLKIFRLIFEKPSAIHEKKQQNMLKILIPALIKSLRSNEELDFLILKIINQASEFLDLFITPKEDFNVLMCLYSESKFVLEEVKYYVYKQHFKGKIGVDIISETFKFYRECPVKNASKFVGNLVSYYAVHTSWRDWEFCFRYCSENNVDDFLNIFFHYVQFLNKPSLNKLDSSVITTMMDDFSEYFSERWLHLMETDKITMNSKAQVFMLKLVASFNVMKLFKKTQAKIIDWSLNNFHKSQDHEVIKECLLCINFLNSFNKNSEIEKVIISQVLAEFIELINREDEEAEILNLSHYKVCLLVKTYEDSYENLWVSLMSLLEKERKLEKVQLIISISYNLLMNKIKKYINFISQSETGQEDLLRTEEKNFQKFILKAQVTNCSGIVIQAAHNFVDNTSQYIRDNDDLSKIMLVSKLYGNLIRTFMSPPLSELCLEISDVHVKSYVAYCSRIINIECQSKGTPSSCNCCILLNDYVALTLEGKICISYLKFFFMNFDKINSHWLLTIKIFNFLINVKNNPIGAYAMINGLISLYNKEKEKSVDERTIKLKMLDVAIFVLNNVDKNGGKGYQKTVLHLYLYLEKLITEGYIIFFELMEKVKCCLSKEIRMKLLCENSSNHS